MTKERAQLLEQVKSELVDAGFVISSDCDVRPSCFDLAARKDDRLVLVKILSNIGSLTSEDAAALLQVAQFFNAIPLVVGNKTQRGGLDDDLVYKRYGLPTITMSLLKKAILEEELPQEYVQRGGRFVAIDGARLREVRMSRGMTKEDLAGCVEVSARAILAYEKQEIDVSTDVAEQLEKVLETDLIIPIDLFQKPDPERNVGQQEMPEIPENVSYLERRVSEFLERLGMRVLWTDRAPFHVAAKEEGPPLMSGVGSLRNPCLQKRVEILRSVSKVAKSDALVIVEEGQTQDRVSEVPVIRQLELDDIEKPRELRRIIAERSES
jgi:putative transcriptional regulator